MDQISVENKFQENIEKENQIKDQTSVHKKKPRLQRTPALVGISIFFCILATLLFQILRIVLNMHISKIYLPLLAYPLNILVISKLYPQKLKIPFGSISSKQFMKEIGLSLPRIPLKMILLGVLLAVFSLSGLLIGSLLTGTYQFDLTTLTIEQVAFATVPGVWEEIYFRGIITFILLNHFKNLKKAVIAQAIIFGLIHISGFQFWEIIDIITVMLIGLVASYAAHKTNSLIPAIIFHFLHDAFLFLVQIPDASFGTLENVYVFGMLWLMLGLGVIITKIAADYLNIKETRPLYTLEKFKNQ